MAITINGNGTVTGVSVGGLPDGIVDAGTLASNSVETAKIATKAVIGSKLGSKAIINISSLGHDSSDQGTTVNNTTSNVGVETTITRKSATSNFLIYITWTLSRPTTTGWVYMSYRLQVNSDSQTSDLQSTKTVDSEANTNVSYIVIDTTTGSVGDVVKIQPRGTNSASNNNQFKFVKTIIFEYEP